MARSAEVAAANERAAQPDWQDFAAFCGKLPPALRLGAPRKAGKSL
jgi:hypothetical protein